MFWDMTLYGLKEKVKLNKSLNIYVEESDTICIRKTANASNIGVCENYKKGFFLASGESFFILGRNGELYGKSS